MIFYKCVDELRIFESWLILNRQPDKNELSIEIKYRKIENRKAIQETSLTNVYLTEIIAFMFTDDYTRGTLKSETFLFSLIDKKEVWACKEDLENFIAEFENFVLSTNKFDKQAVFNKENNKKIDWFVTDISPIIKRKSFLGFLKPNSEYRTLRLFDDLTFCIHNGTTNLFFTFHALNFDDIFEAVPIEGTKDYQKGNKIEVVKESISGLLKFERDLEELDKIKNFIKKNRLEFSFFLNLAFTECKYGKE